MSQLIIKKIKEVISTGDLNLANSLIIDAVNSDPSNLDVRFEQACFLIQTGRADQAINVLQYVLDRDAGNISYLAKLGTCYAIIGDRKKAISIFKKILLIDESMVSANANLALALAEEGQYKEALIYAQKGLESDPENLPLYSTQALILKHLGRLQEAIASLEIALGLDESNISVLSSLSGLLIENNQIDDAKNILQKLIKLAPLYSEAYRIYSTIIDNVEIEKFIDKIQNILQGQSKQPTDLINYSYALGRLYEKIGTYQKSFHYYKQANDESRKLYQYDIEEDKNQLLNIAEKYSVEFVSKHRAEITGYSPIFILGMPRSGTSLVEQVLASHSTIYGAGELNSVELLQQKDIGDIGADNLAKEYLAIIEDLLKGKKCFTDKMPLNFRYIGFIKSVFPNAKIINCRRNARDVILSIYKTKFSGNLPFAQNLEEISQYYKLYEDMMTHWHEAFPNQIYDLSYEDLVDDTKAQVEQLLKFCDLEWQDDCLSFYKNDRSVTTASAMQVRKPIYKTAIEYWKNYEEFLRDLDV